MDTLNEQCSRPHPHEQLSKSARKCSARSTNTRLARPSWSASGSVSSSCATNSEADRARLEWWRSVAIAWSSAAGDVLFASGRTACVRKHEGAGRRRGDSERQQLSPGFQLRPTTTSPARRALRRQLGAFGVRAPVLVYWSLRSTRRSLGAGLIPSRLHLPVTRTDPVAKNERRGASKPPRRIGAHARCRGDAGPTFIALSPMMPCLFNFGASGETPADRPTYVRA